MQHREVRGVDNHGLDVHDVMEPPQCLANLDGTEARGSGSVRVDGIGKLWEKESVLCMIIYQCINITPRSKPLDNKVCGAPC